MLTYKLLDNHTGVILTRQPEIAVEEMTVCFEDAPADATAVFETKHGDTFYRVLWNGECSIPVQKMIGAIKVAVVLLDSATPPVRWQCEGLRADKLQSGEILILPDDSNLPETVAALRLENQEICKSFSELQKQYDQLGDRLEKIMEGYAFT